MRTFRLHAVLMAATAAVMLSACGGNSRPGSPAGSTNEPTGTPLSVGQVLEFEEESGLALQSVNNGLVRLGWPSAQYSILASGSPKLVKLSKDPVWSSTGTADSNGASTPSGSPQPKGQYLAAKGAKLVAARVDYTGPVPEKGGPPNVALQIEGRRYPVSLINGVHYFVTAVPAAATDVALTFGETSNIEQTINLITGQKAAGYPEVYYRSGYEKRSGAGLSGVSILVNKTFVLPFANPTIGSEWRPDQWPTQVQINNLHLAYWMSLGDRAAKPAPSSDKAYLIFDASSSGGNTWHGPIDPRQVVLTTDTGEKITANRITGSSTEQLIDSSLYFIVPAGITGGTISAKPGVVNHAKGFFEGAKLDYGQQELKFEFKIN